MANSGNTNNNEDTLLNEVHKKVSVLQELYIEFFATLMPGFVMTLSTLILLFLFHYFTFDQLLFTTVLSEHLNPWLGFISILVISYTFGAILYRKDLKKLDRISSYIQWRTSSESEKKRLAVQYSFFRCSKKCNVCNLIDKRKKSEPNSKKQIPKSKSHFFSFSFLKIIFRRINNMSFACCFDKLVFRVAPGCLASKYFVEGYPYKYLRQYLFKRGLYHLLNFVPWCPAVEADTPERSKMIINELKTVIKSGKNGHYMLDLLRNEGHIRMLTSMWYVMKYLKRITILLFILGLVIKLLPADNKIVSNKTNFVAWEITSSENGAMYAESASVCQKGSQEDTNNGNNVTKEKSIQHAHICCAFLAAGLLVFWFWWGKRSIEKSIHYVRIREIVMVLEQAYHIRISSPNSPFWNVITLRHDAFVEKFNNCHNCNECEIPDCVRRAQQIWEVKRTDNSAQEIIIKCNYPSMVYTITNNASQDIKS